MNQTPTHHQAAEFPGSSSDVAVIQTVHSQKKPHGCCQQEADQGEGLIRRDGNVRNQIGTHPVPLRLLRISVLQPGYSQEMTDFSMRSFTLLSTLNQEGLIFYFSNSCMHPTNGHDLITCLQFTQKVLLVFGLLVCGLIMKKYRITKNKRKKPMVVNPIRLMTVRWDRPLIKQHYTYTYL